MQNNKKNRIAYRIALTAVFLALGSLCRLFTLNITIFGGSGMKVGLSGVFTSFPAILFGPLYGGMASAASDIIGCIIAPTGAYNPLYTLTAFAGGFIKGLIWMLLRKANAKTLRISLVSVFSLILALGTVFYACLAVNGYSFGVVASAEELPVKTESASIEKNAFTSLVVSRVKVKDTYTVTEPFLYDGTAYFPESVDSSDAKFTLTEKSLDAVSAAVIPGKYTVGNGVAEYMKEKGITVYTEEASALFKTLSDAGVVCETEIPEYPENAEYGYTSNDNFRKTLAGYINFATFGLALTGIFGMAAVLAETVISFALAKKNKNGFGYGLRIFTAIFAAELVQTTANTVILREITYASSWSSYPFLVVWLPRAVEGLLICVIQAYLISFLYAFLQKKIFKNDFITE